MTKRIGNNLYEKDDSKITDEQVLPPPAPVAKTLYTGKANEFRIGNLFSRPGERWVRVSEILKGGF